MNPTAKYTHLDAPNGAGETTRAAVRRTLANDVYPVQGYTSLAVAAHIWRSEAWVREILRQMVRDGEVERITEGPGHPVYYRLRRSA